MKLHGSFDSDRSRQAVYETLTDPRQMLRSFPDVKLTGVTDGGFTASTQVGLGPVSEPVEIHFTIAQRQEGQSAVYRGEGEGLGSHLNLDASFQLSDRQGQPGTHVEWSGEADIDGPLGSMADGALQDVVQQDIQNMLKSLDQSAPTSAPTS